MTRLQTQTRLSISIPLIPFKVEEIQVTLLSIGDLVYLPEAKGLAILTSIEIVRGYPEDFLPGGARVCYRLTFNENLVAPNLGTLWRTVTFLPTAMLRVFHYDWNALLCKLP